MYIREYIVSQFGFLVWTFVQFVIILGGDGVEGIVILASCDHQFIRVHENKSDTTYK